MHSDDYYWIFCFVEYKHDDGCVLTSNFDVIKFYLQNDLTRKCRGALSECTFDKLEEFVFITRDVCP